MGIGDSYASYETLEARRVTRAADDAILDCKDWALAAEKIGGLVAVRGYILFTGQLLSDDRAGMSFTEHWWCTDSAGDVVDVTGLSVAIESSLVPLKKQDDERICLNYNGPCSWPSNPCAWCLTRRALERRGHERSNIDFTRLYLDRMLREQARLRSEVDSLRREVRRILGSKAKKVAP